MRLRLFLSFTLIVLISVATFTVLARIRSASEVRTFMLRGGVVGLESLVSTLEDYYRANQTWQGVGSILRTPGQPPGRGRGNPGQGIGPGMSEMMNQRLRLADAQGNLVADTANPNPIGILSQTEIERAIPLAVDRQVVGYLLPEGGMAFDQSDQTRLIARLNSVALTAGGIAAAFSLVLALLLAYRLLRPIQELTQAAESLAQGDLSQRVEVRGSDELAVLGDTFNRMASSLQHAEESRRAMTADIAHELRNPLAVQRANLEALQDGIYPLTSQNIDPVLEQNRLLTRLVEDLRTLALADAGELELERIPTDFPGLVNRIVERFQTQANATEINLDLSLPKECPPIFIDPGRVEQIIGNLFSNALRHTPSGGRIHVEVNCTPSEVLLKVHDSGPGIPEDALPHIFDRFYRADKSRSREQGGTGLGLAIARQLAEAQGGSLTAENHPQGGALFTLVFPYE